jgi:hypothetical protein
MNAFDEMISAILGDIDLIKERIAIDDEVAIARQVNKKLLQLAELKAAINEMYGEEFDDC